MRALLGLAFTHAPAMFSGHAKQGSRAHTLARLETAPRIAGGAFAVVASPGAPIVERVEVKASSLCSHASAHPFIAGQVGRDGLQRIAGAVGVGGHQAPPPFSASACAV
jgi:hypothetical protein